MWYLLLFPRTVSFFTGHGLREDILNPNFLHLWIVSFYISHSFLMTLLVTPPCTAQFHVPLDVFHGGVPLLENSISMAPELQGHGLGVCLYTHNETPALQPKSSGSMQKRKDIMRQSPSERQDEVLEWSRKEKPLDKQQWRERKRSETTGTPITTVRAI